MAFSVSEMLEMPGHDDVPDHVTIEYLREMQYNGSRSATPSFLYDSYDPASDDSHPPPSVRRGQSSLGVHGRPVPGDRDFRRSNQRIHKQGGGLDSSFLTEDFAPERFEEMRKMLRIMMSTHERNFGSRNARDRMKRELGVSGLEDEHKQYVEKLENEWRAVGKILRCKPKEKYDESAECSVSDGSSQLEVESCHSSKYLEVEAPASLGSYDEEADSARVSQEKVKEVVEDEHIGRGKGSAKAKGKLHAQPDENVEGEDDSSESIKAGSEIIDDDDGGGRVAADNNSSNAGLSSIILPGGTDERLWHESPHEAESSNAHDGVDILEKSVYNETILPEPVKPEHGFDSTAEDATSLPANDINSERNPSENPAKGFLRLHSKFTPPQSLVIPTDPENPLESSTHPRAPDRRHSDPYSPVTDRSYIPQGREQKRTPRRLPEEGRRPKQNPSWVSGLKTQEKSPKRIPSMDYRRRPDLRGNHLLSNVLEDSPDLPTIPKPRYYRSATIDSRRGKTTGDDPKSLGVASKGVSDTSNQLDITPTSPILPSIRVERSEKSCGVSEPSHRSCAVCAARQAANSGDKSPLGKSGSRSPYSPHQGKSGRNLFGATDSSANQSYMKKSSGIYTPLTGAKKSNVLLKTNSARFSASVDLTDADKSFRRQSSVRSSEESPRLTDIQGSSNEFRSGLAESPTLARSSTTWNERTQIPKEKLTPGGPRRGGKVDRVARFAEMQNFWKSDKFLNASGKRKTQSFYRIFSELHESHERFYAAYRERVSDTARSKNDPPPFVVPLHNSSERIRSPRTFL